MIHLHIVDGDLLESTADAILLPIDGALPANADGEQVPRSLGRIARAFSRRFPDSDLVDEIESQVTFPLGLGGVAAVELPAGAPFRYAVLLSVLPHHADQTSEEMMRAAVASAFVEALRLCDSLALRSVATPLLKAGWRVSTTTAITLMLNTLGSVELRHPLAVEVRLFDEPSAVSEMRALARSFGFESS